MDSRTYRPSPLRVYLFTPTGLPATCVLVYLLLPLVEGYSKGLMSPFALGALIVLVAFASTQGFILDTRRNAVAVTEATVRGPGRWLGNRTIAREDIDSVRSGRFGALRSSRIYSVHGGQPIELRSELFDGAVLRDLREELGLQDREVRA